VLALLACGQSKPAAVATLPPLPTLTAPSPVVTIRPPEATSTLAAPTPTGTRVVPDTPTPPPAVSPSEVTPIPTDTLPPPEVVPTAADAFSAPGLKAAQVVNVVDGDTIDVVLNGAEYRVRYILVDTPETKHPTKGVQPFGPEASEANRQMVEGQTVYLEKDVSETDRYDRLLRYVYLADGRMVNEELLRMGLAQVATFPPDVKYVDRFLAVQREAQAAGVGLWGTQEAIAEPTAAPDVSPSEVTPIPDGNVAIVALDKRAEYVDLRNGGTEAVDLTGWRLLSEKGNQDCALGGVIGSGETLRVWAMSSDAGQGGFNCGYSDNIWSNSKPDAAVLFDADGAMVARME